MSKREKILAGLVLLLIVGFGATHLWQRYQDALSRRRTSVLTAREALDTTKLAEARGQMAMKNLEGWQQRSLPSSIQQAQALYRTWLLDRLREAGLTEGVLKTTNQSRRSTAYETVGYTIEARGTTAAVTAFLYDFYRSDQLHKILHLRLRPAADSDNLFVTMSVEGLIVQGAIRDNSLSEGESDRLALDDKAAYRESIVGRNVFQPFRPPSAERRDEAPQGTDQAAETFVTSIQGGTQVWLTNRANGRVFRLHEGDRIRLPGFFGRVEKIRAHEVVVSADNQDDHVLVRVGKNLREGTPIKQQDDDEASG